jgi:hypothetical protein
MEAGNRFLTFIAEWNPGKDWSMATQETNRLYELYNIAMDAGNIKAAIRIRHYVEGQTPWAGKPPEDERK